MSGWYELGLQELKQNMREWDEWFFVQLYHDELCGMFDGEEWVIFV